MSATQETLNILMVKLADPRVLTPCGDRCPKKSSPERCGAIIQGENNGKKAHCQILQEVIVTQR